MAPVRGAYQLQQLETGGEVTQGGDGAFIDQLHALILVAVLIDVLQSIDDAVQMVVGVHAAGHGDAHQLQSGPDGLAGDGVLAAEGAGAHLHGADAGLLIEGHHQPLGSTQGMPFSFRRSPRYLT